MAGEERAHAMATPTTAQSDLLGALTWRCIGPFRGGRVVAVAGDPMGRVPNRCG
jgi:hypothetical protein